MNRNKIEELTYRNTATVEVLKDKVNELVRTFNALAKDADRAFERGFDAGKQAAEEESRVEADLSYEDGLNDAWKCARKIIGSPLNGYNMMKIFDEATDVSIFSKYSASEAIAKIKEYEEKQTKPKPHLSFRR